MKKHLLILFTLFSFWGIGQNYNMTNTTINTCSGFFYDTGGPSSNYGNSQNITMTFCSNIPGQSIQFNFTQFATEAGFDVLAIFDGPNTGSPLIGNFSGNNSPGIITSTGSCITFRFQSDWLVTAAGWSASISCVNPPPPPPCSTCADACTACGFSTTPTVQQVVDNCPNFPFNPQACSGATRTRCHTFTAMNATVSFNVIITSNCGSGNVTNFSWILQNASCGGTIQSGNLSNLNFTGLTVGQSYTFCYTFTVPSGCCHTTHAPFFVGACNTSPPTVTGATRCGPGTVTLSATSCPGGTINWYSSASGGTPIATGPTFTTPSISTTTTYYASCNISSCESTRVPVVATITTPITPTFNQAGPFCSGAAIAALPTTSTNGITGNWSPVINNTTTTTYTFTPSAGQCANTATMTITINPSNTVTAASSNPTICTNTEISPAITHTTSGATGIGTATGLPPGVTANWSANTLTISGTPTTSGTFTYTIPLTGGCGTVNATGTITVNPINTVGPASSSPTLCVNTAISPVITHTTTGATGIGTATGLPAGVSAFWSGNTLTISGTPTSTGSFSYTIPLTGGCGTVNATGTITVISENTVSSASSSPTLCVNTAISPAITHSTTGATGIGTVTGLPAGVTASWVANTITISGTPTTSGTFTYTIPLTGGCGTVNATGTITVNPTNTVSAASSSPTVCVNTAINPVITHATTGATGIGTASGLPTGVSASWSGNSITISGTPTVTGTFTYTIPLTGGCGTVNATGTLTVNDAVTPSFAAVGPYCSGASIPALPVSSQNGITGTWSPTIDNTVTTTYTFSPIPGQCANTTTITVTINPSSIPTFASVGPYCGGATIPALPNTSQNGISGSWSPAINNTATTTYTFTPASGQCATTTTMSVAITTVPAPTISGAGSYCVGDNINILTAAGISGSTLIWYSDANLTTQVGTGSSIQPGSNQGVTTYYLTATIDGCTSSPSLAQVTINPLPNISGGSDITACQGQTITLTGSGGISYTWDNGVTNGVPFTQQESSVTYTVTGVDANGCSNQDQVVVNVEANPEPTFVPSVTSGCSPLQVSFINTSGNSPSSSCTWDFGNGGTATSCGPVSTIYSTPGCYNIALTINYGPGCTSTTNLINLICVDNNPIAQFEPTPATADINVPINFTNLSSGATNYSWNFGDNLGVSSEPNPAYAYTDIGNFLVTLIAENDNGCKDSISKIIVINEQLIFYVPNAFTPDGNKHNETFQPIFTSGFDIYGYNLLIFNRWGEVVFESNNAAVGWNGTYGGEIAPEGVYVWQIKVKVLGVDKPEIHRGHVNLLR